MLFRPYVRHLVPDDLSNADGFNSNCRDTRLPRLAPSCSGQGPSHLDLTGGETLALLNIC
jgi:hypothetical protein